QITLFLADPQARLPSFPRMGWSEFPFAVAVKTGTSSRYRDAWTVAYSSRYLVGVWIGHPDFRPMARLSGYRASAQLVHRIMNLLHRDQQDGLEALSFPSPRGYDAHRVCAVSGRRATPACARVVLEWLPPGQEVVGACEVHRHLAIDRRNGLLATSTTPAASIEVRSFVDLPARYAAWAARVGIPHPPRLPSPLGAGDFGLLGFAPVGALVSIGPIEQSGRIEITSPRQDLRLLFDPETPPEMNTVALRAVVDPSPEQIVWYVDGQPFKTAEHPFTVRWPLAVGEHTFQARVPFTELRSGTVRIAVE
ncbi:MAG: hypothetical protein GY842_17450, partial [bacterium]|nr:hypothetical protein [bacterium]